MSIDKQIVEHVAHLARIELGELELSRLSKQLEHILGFIDKLSSLDIKKTHPTSHILPINNVLREDTPKVSIPVEKALLNAPSKKNNFFVVPKIIE